MVYVSDWPALIVVVLGGVAVMGLLTVIVAVLLSA
jgi:hypothetical protein